MDASANVAAEWPDTIYDNFKRLDIRQVGYVPDAGHRRLIERCIADPDINDVVLTTEQEGVGLVAGATLGGHRSALLMQSSGVGNCINAFSLITCCGFPCLLLVTMRGEYGEFNPLAGSDGLDHRAGAQARRLPDLSHRGCGRC